MKNIIKELEKLGKTFEKKGIWSRVDQWYLDEATVQLTLGSVTSAKNYLGRLSFPDEFLKIVGGIEDVQ